MLRSIRLAVEEAPALAACCMSHLVIYYYKRLKSNRGLRASRSRRSPNMAPATMAGPTMGKEACLGTVGEAWTRRLDGCVVGRRPPHRRR